MPRTVHYAVTAVKDDEDGLPHNESAYILL